MRLFCRGHVGLCYGLLQQAGWLLAPEGALEGVQQAPGAVLVLENFRPALAAASAPRCPQQITAPLTTTAPAHTLQAVEGAHTFAVKMEDGTVIWAHSGQGSIPGSEELVAVIRAAGAGEAEAQ